MRGAFVTTVVRIKGAISILRVLGIVFAVRLERILSGQLQTSETRRLVDNHVVIAIGSRKAPNITVAAVEGFNIAQHVIRAAGRGNAAETAEGNRTERAGERQTGFTAEEAAALTHRAVVTIEAAFELEADLIAVAEVFGTLQAPAVARIPTGLHVKRVALFGGTVILGGLLVEVFKAGIESAVKRHVSGHGRAGKNAENGESGERLFHDVAFT